MQIYSGEEVLRCCAGRSTWRIIVRQLESMIRLSEAMAKLECMNEVQKRDVKEAFRLLNKSIIRMEQPDIHLEEEEDEAFAGDIEMREINGENIQENRQEQAVLKRKLTLSFKDSRNLSTMLYYIWIIIHKKHALKTTKLRQPGKKPRSTEEEEEEEKDDDPLLGIHLIINYIIE
uniref:MCM AAA-lid domain-containing protein n=1 Tax=Glossina palpalis gambiensis TaxID=67801 RepID=A0A1B0BKY1_9MUSC